MAPATDSAKTSPARRFWIGIALVTAFLGTGCAQIRAFRKGDDRPVFGTDAADTPKAAGARGSSGDVYVDRLRQTGPPSLRSRNAATIPGRRRAATTARRSCFCRLFRFPRRMKLGARPPPPSRSKRPRASRVDEPARPRTEGPETRARGCRERAWVAERVATLVAVPPERKPRAPRGAHVVSGGDDPPGTGGIDITAEDVLLVRRSPKQFASNGRPALSWGREVLYEPGRSALMHVHMEDSVIPLPSLSMKPDSPAAMRNSRHPISEAGYADPPEHGAGPRTPAPRQLHARSDQLPGPRTARGPRRSRTQDRSAHPDAGNLDRLPRPRRSHLPRSLKPRPAMAMLERCAFRDLKIDVPGSAATQAFDPDARWGSPGLLQRLARAT